MPERSPAVSVVIPTKNRHAMLAEAIASVAAPGLRRLRNPRGRRRRRRGASSSPSGSPPSAAIRCVDNRQAGQVRARNLGVSLARGEIVAFLDDDDRWGSKAYLGAVHAAIGGGAAASFASGDIVVVDDHLQLARDDPVRRLDRPRGDPLRQQDPGLRLRLCARAERPARPVRRDAADLLGLGLVSPPARGRRRLPRSRAAGGADRRPSPRDFGRRPFRPARRKPGVARRQARAGAADLAQPRKHRPRPGRRTLSRRPPRPAAQSVAGHRRRHPLHRQLTGGEPAGPFA